MCRRPQIFSRASSLEHKIQLVTSFLLRSTSLDCDILRHVLLFPNTVEELVVSVGHEKVHANEVGNGSETTGGDVTLLIGLLVSTQFHLVVGAWVGRVVI